MSDRPDELRAYLDALAGRLRGPRAHVERLLEEAGGHLADAVEEGLAAGAAPSAARRDALRRFGPPDAVARSMNRATRARYRGTVGREVAVALTAVAAAGLLAMGLTGVVASVGARLTSSATVYGLPAGVRMPAASCRHWLAVQPGARTCRQAATLEAASDLTLGLAAAGIVGLLILVALVLVWRRSEPTGLVPASFPHLVAVVAFGIGTVGTAVPAARDAVIGSTWGAGVFWSAAAVCGAAALCSGVLLRRTRQDRPEAAKGMVAQ